MKKVRLMFCLIFVSGLVIGYFAGRAHLKYQSRQAMSQSFQSFSALADTKIAPQTKLKSLRDVLERHGQWQAQEREIKAKYIETYIKLPELEAKMYEDVVDGTIPGLFGKVQNLGTKTLKEVEIKVSFLDKDGKSVWEDVYYPVYTSTVLNFLPLKPNATKEFGYKAKNVPREWEPGNILWKISDIAFAEE